MCTQFSPSRSNGGHIPLLVIMVANIYRMPTRHTSAVLGILQTYHKVLKTTLLLPCWFELCLAFRALVEAFSEELFVCLSATFPPSGTPLFWIWSFSLCFMTPCFSHLWLLLLGLLGGVGLLYLTFELLKFPRVLFQDMASVVIQSWLPQTV